MGHKAIPITAKSSKTTCANMAVGKYMAQLVGDLKGMYGSKKYIDPGKAFKKGTDDAADNIEKFPGKIGNKQPFEV